MTKRQKEILQFIAEYQDRHGISPTHREICEEDQGKRPFTFLDTPIGYSSDVERMGVHRAPVESFAPHSPAAKAYRTLSQEIAERIAG